MKAKITFFISLIFTLNVFSQSQTAKVVGYLPTYRFSSASQLAFCKLTHLNLCFANPDASGNLIFPSFGSVRTEALANNPNIKIFISLAGGWLTSEQATNWSALIDIPANRPAFIQKIVNFVTSNNLDGVDIDLEWDHVTSGYSGFVVELKQALVAANKQLSVAFPNNTRFENVSNEALAAFDFINIMSYDATGPWAPNQPGQHSSFAFAQNGINFWKNTVGVVANKLVLGVPFYGYDFVNSTTCNAKTFSEVVAMNATYAQIDNVGNLYYNGIPTIESKVQLVKDQVAGIMIWEIGQDVFSQNSLLKAIHDKFTGLGVTTTALCGNQVTLSNAEIENTTFQFYPNPVKNVLQIKTNKKLKLVCYNVFGQQLGLFSADDFEVTTIDTSQMSNGVYFFKVFDEESNFLCTKRILKE